jgi:hypothetical protein
MISSIFCVAALAFYYFLIRRYIKMLVKIMHLEILFLDVIHIEQEHDHGSSTT